MGSVTSTRSFTDCQCMTRSYRMGRRAVAFREFS